jgi:hypothetical protein|tara:strand:+ start:60 stop:518 length:459 start_codon:yes stop_codon:yes gene_type:complete
MTDNELKQIIFDGFESIKNIKNITPSVRHRMLGSLLSMNKNSWVVIGITKAALIKFIENDYKRPKGVNRSHIDQRSKTSKIMFERNDWTVNSWWKFYKDRDKCILATSSENMNKDPDIIFADVPSGLFKTSGFAYNVKDKEKKFLMEISKKL